MTWVAYILIALVGISLGLIGGGGSILTVPILVYGFGIKSELATNYSLIIVGISAVLAWLPKLKKKEFNFGVYLFYGVSSIISLILTKKYLLPLLPDTVLAIEGFTLTKDTFLMILFGLLMLFASLSMIIQKESKTNVAYTNNKVSAMPIGSIVRLSGQGFMVGVLTGVLGAGGGFIIIPVLTQIAKLPMKIAIGTSLAIVATNTLFGFTFFLVTNTQPINWIFLISITAISIAGLLLGNRVGDKVSGAKLKVGFGYFVLFVGVLVFILEAYKNI